MIAVVITVAGLMTIRAIEPARAAYWWSFSRRWALAGLALTFTLLALVSTIGILVGRRGLGTVDPTWVQDLAAALVAQTSLRRYRNSDRGGTLVLGFLPDVFNWIGHFVKSASSDWAAGLSDPELVAAAARTDDRLKGIRKPGSLEKRVAWRKDAAARLGAGGALRDESREELISMVEAGYSAYLIKRQP